jgi:hypothetical protein
MKRVGIISCLILLLVAGFIGAQQKRIYNDGEIDYVPAGVKITLFAEDMESSLDYIEYTVNKGDLKEYNGPISFSDEGRYVIAYRAFDMLGNIAKEKIYSCIVDATPPYFSGSASGPAFMEDGVAYLTSDTALALWAEDELSGVSALYVSIDGSGFSEYTGPSTVPGEGKHTGQAYAEDNVGNRTKTYSGTAYIDDTPPEVEIVPENDFVVLQGDNFTRPTNSYSVDAFDNIAGVREITVSIDGSDEFVYSEPFAVQGTGWHTVTAKASDYLGNTSDPVSLRFYVDTKTPSTELEITPE